MDDIKTWLAQYDASRRTRMLKSNEPFMERLRPLYEDCQDDGEIAYLFVREIMARPTCKHCGGRASWLKNRFAEFCSTRCANLFRGAGYQIKEDIKKKYGVDNIQKVPEITAKRQETMLKKYGKLVSDKHVSSRPETWKRLNEKGRETIKQKYGVDNVGQLPGHMEKMRETMRVNYGVTHHSRIPHMMVEREAGRVIEVAAKLPEGCILNKIEEPDDEAGEANRRFHLTCEQGHDEILPSETFKFRLRTVGHFCAACTGITTSKSIKEINLRDWIASVYDGTIIDNDRKLIAPYEIDILLPNLKIAIEFAVLYWHSEGRKPNDYHLVKLNACKAAGYRLITIFEDEWDLRRSIVENRLLHLFNKSGKAIYARKCEVRTINSAQARDFCEKHHIQGYANSTHKLALFDDERIVAVMTFAKPSLAKGERARPEGHWELSRFCLSENVVGAANKLFAHFIKTQDPTHITTFSDLRWNTGNVYGKMGFTFSHNTNPNYWYFKGVERIHRFALRKNEKDAERGLTEREARAQEGWRRIFDCGHAKWLWRKP